MIDDLDITMKFMHEMARASALLARSHSPSALARSTPRICDNSQHNPQHLFGGWDRFRLPPIQLPARAAFSPSPSKRLLRGPPQLGDGPVPSAERIVLGAEPQILNLRDGSQRSGTLDYVNLY